MIERLTENELDTLIAGSTFHSSNAHELFDRLVASEHAAHERLKAMQIKYDGLYDLFSRLSERVYGPQETPNGKE